MAQDHPDHPGDASPGGSAAGPHEQETVIGHPRLTPGEQIGPYRIIEQIGEGGFAIVYLAEQTEPVRRKVSVTTGQIMAGRHHQES